MTAVEPFRFRASILPQPADPCVACSWGRHARCCGTVLRFVVLNDDRPQEVPCPCTETPRCGWFPP